jgi:ABC-type sugar transport system ATPase subunit
MTAATVAEISGLPAASLKRISKAFPGVLALDDVSFDVNRGEIHALVGENGAGKSTLVKILAGLLRPDSGVIELDGQEVALTSVHNARTKGISVIPQEVLVVPGLSAGRNILLGFETFLVRKAGLSVAERQVVTQALGRAGATFQESTPAAAMSVPELRLAQIARTLIHPADVIVLDEPTAVLSEADADHLLERLLTFRSEGKAIVYVSHRLSEVLRLAQRITVLRDGRNVGTFRREEVDRDRIIALMAKPDRREIEGRRRRTPEGPDAGAEPVLKVDGLTRAPNLLSVSLSVRPGEIVGVAGVQGSGHGHLLHAIAGLDLYVAGRVTIDQAVVPPGSIRAAYEAGAILVPADRRNAAIVPMMNLRTNLVLPIRSSTRRLGVRLLRNERNAARRYIKLFSIQTPNMETLASSLSGGNQQKLALARALESSPRVLLLEEPTQGIDINAKDEIRLLIQRLADEERVAIVIATSEFEELLELADVIHVMCLGRLVATMPAAEASYAAILHHALP